MTVEFNTWLPELTKDMAPVSSDPVAKPTTMPGPNSPDQQTLNKTGLASIVACLKENQFPLLVTGVRGVGCLEIVRQALEEEAYRDRHPADNEGAEGVNATPRIHLTIALRIPRSISREALLKRLLRKIYLSLVEKCVADVPELRPLVIRARQAYIRSAGGNIEIKDDIGQKTQQNSKVSLGPNFVNWGAELGAAAEQSVAHSLLEKFANITAEELEDELEILSTGLSNSSWHFNQGAVSSVLEKAKQKATQKLRACLQAFNKEKASIILTIVLYEMDQLDPLVDSPSDTVSCFPSLLRELRSLFGFDSKHLRLIAIGGANMALDLLKAQLSPNSLLPRLFAGRVHIPISHACPPDTPPPWILKTATNSALEIAAKTTSSYYPELPPIIADAIWLHAYYHHLNMGFGNTCLLRSTDPDHQIFLDPIVTNWPKTQA